MRIVMTAVFLALVAAAPIVADGAWLTAVEADVRALAAAPGAAPVSEAVLQLALETAVRHFEPGYAAEAAPVVYAAAVRAELRLRLGEGLPRVRAELSQEFRIARRAGGDAVAHLRTLERVRRNLERADPGPGGRAMPWWKRPGIFRGWSGA
jgi:hypothetical protein